MLFAIPEAVWENPFGSVTSTGQSMDDVSLLCPDHALAIGIPVEFKMILYPKVIRNLDPYAEPMRGPARTERFTNVCLPELVRGSIFECWTSLVRWRVDLEFDPFIA